MSDMALHFSDLSATTPMAPTVRAEPSVGNGRMESSQAHRPRDDGGAPLSTSSRSPRWIGTVATIAIGAAIGGCLGVGVAAVAGSSVSATALVQVAPTPDPWLSGVQQSGITGGDTQAFAASELTYLSSSGFSAAAAQRAGVEPGVAVEASRVGQSTVISMSATGPTADEAIKLLNGALSVYTDARTTALTAQTDAAVKSVDDTLKDVSSSPFALTNPDAQQARVDRLLGQRDALQTLANQDVKAVTVVEAPTAEEEAVPNWVVGTALGTVVGALGLLGVVRLVGRRQSEGGGPVHR